MSAPTQNLAGLFKHYAPPGYANHERRIFYVGKATMGAFDEDDACEMYFSGRSTFWSFARSVSKVADANCIDLSNLAWSNIFKQGVTSRNPLGEIAEAQREPATLALRNEVDTLKPSLIVLANAGYYEEIPKSAFLIRDGENSDGALTRSVVDGVDKWDLWFRASYDGFPPIVWMYHPQGKPREYVSAALSLIRQVTGWANHDSQQRVPR